MQLKKENSRNISELISLNLYIQLTLEQHRFEMWMGCSFSKTYFLQWVFLRQLKKENFRNTSELISLNLYIQLILEQHRFEMWNSVTSIVLLINTLEYCTCIFSSFRFFVTFSFFQLTLRIQYIIHTTYNDVRFPPPQHPRAHQSRSQQPWDKLRPSLVTRWESHAWRLCPTGQRSQSPPGQAVRAGRADRNPETLKAESEATASESQASAIWKGCVRL